jgi:hypothetical protein
VLLNEFRGQLPFGELLDLVDKWPKTVKWRCQEYVPFMAKKVIVTSPHRPKDVYINRCSDPDSMAQLLRRFRIFEWDLSSKKFLELKCTGFSFLANPHSKKLRKPPIPTHPPTGGHQRNPGNPPTHPPAPGTGAGRGGEKRGAQGAGHRRSGLSLVFVFYITPSSWQLNELSRSAQ